MQRLVQMSHSRIVAVRREQVLDQIVGSDGEEINLPHQPWGKPNRRRHLHHDPDLNLRIMLETLFVELSLRLDQDFARSAQLLEARNHRKENLNLMASG